MTVGTINDRFTAIEQSWKEASKADRTGYLGELAEMSTELGQVSGADGDKAIWLIRRINRVVRNIQNTPGPA